MQNPPLVLSYFLAVAWLRCLTGALCACVTALCLPAYAAPATGDTYVYRVINRYNGETVAHLHHEVSDASTAAGVVTSITADRPAITLQRTEIHTRDGQWLRHPLDNHGRAIDYEFAQALPAVPPVAGQSWSVRVNARADGADRARSVRIDGRVLGNERVRVPAGEFDTVKIHRIIYPGDPGNFRTETRIDETDWFAPALGRSVRTETNSSWEEPCGRRYCTYRGDWHLRELHEVRKRN